MLAKSDLPVVDDFDISSEISTDLLIRQEIEQMRQDVHKIQERLESFEGRLSEFSKDHGSPKPAIPTGILIGPIAKNLNSCGATPPSPVEIETTQSSVDVEDINEFFDDYESSDVDSLKRQLQEKLRKAEVEMSIQRARVFQQKAELEEMKLQLEQREAAIRKSVDQQHREDPTKRWERHFDFIRKK